jgi:ammonium transporter, Amt family
MTMINAGDTAWVLMSAALVLLMTPGLALFYGGMVRRKNVLSVLMQCFMAMCVLSVMWVLFGYSLSFAPSERFSGGMQWFGLVGIGLEPYPDYSATIPHMAFVVFQLMFAVITPALIVGAFAERMKFSSFLIFCVLWSLFVYYPVCHWVWGVGGWLRRLGVLDFAGGLVVHSTAGIAALVTTVVIGKRKNLEANVPAPHNLPFVALGTGLLWFGWFGFNAGSALAANGVAANAFMVTNTAAAMAGMCWAILEWVRNGSPTIFGTLTGVIAGLATVTPCAGFITPLSAMAVGIAASVSCYIIISMIKPQLGYDDSLDAFGVHGVGGMLGTVLVGLFATKTVNLAGADGLFSGNPQQLILQLVGVSAVLGYTLVVTFVIYWLINYFMRVRVSERDELMGLDLTQHRERAYTLVE